VSYPRPCIYSLEIEDGNYEVELIEIHEISENDFDLSIQVTATIIHDFVAMLCV
jgi:hypothetical protein